MKMKATLLVGNLGSNAIDQEKKKKNPRKNMHRYCNTETDKDEKELLRSS